jgi:NitT/TauT family transport system permease protein
MAQPQTHVAEKPSLVRRAWRRVWPCAFWVAVWQLVSVAVGQQILVASPLATLEALAGLVGQAAFWTSVATSMGRILAGFAGGTLAAVVLAAVASRVGAVRSVLAPLVQVVKAAPVASFIILVLIWVPSRRLSIVIAFLMAFPIVYTNVLQGIAQTDPQLLEMADVFGVGAGRRLRYVYVPQVAPYLQAACSLALGLCWKAGVAAEVIGLPRNSIGEHLYEAKIYLDTPELFAWTLVVVCVSLLFERVFGALLATAVERMGAGR